MPLSIICLLKIIICIDLKKILGRCSEFDTGACCHMCHRKIGAVSEQDGASSLRSPAPEQLRPDWDF